MEKAKTRKIKKWDEVHGEHEVEVSDNTGGCGPGRGGWSQPFHQQKSDEEHRGYGGAERQQL